MNMKLTQYPSKQFYLTHPECNHPIRGESRLSDDTANCFHFLFWGWVYFRNNFFLTHPKCSHPIFGGCIRKSER